MLENKREVIAFLRRCPIAPDQQDKRWREQSLRGKLDITYSCARHGVCREFTPVFAKHLRSFWLIDSLAIGVDRMKRNFGPMQKKGRKGGALERRELRVVVTRRGGLLPVGRPTGNYSIRGHKGVIQSRS